MNIFYVRVSITVVDFKNSANMYALRTTPRSNAGACAMHSYPVAGRENFPRENLIETIAETGVTRKKVERQ